MIDTLMIEKAAPFSSTIRAIDESWRKYVDNLKENILTVPFPGEYSLFLQDKHAFVEGYKGELIIDKLYHNQMYRLTQPVLNASFTIYGTYDSSGHFNCFTSRPEIGVHYMGMGHHGHQICTGDINYPKQDSHDNLKEACSQIIKAFRIINMHSLGEILLPKEYEQLREILADKNVNNDHKIKALLAKGLVEPIL